MITVKGQVCRGQIQIEDGPILFLDGDYRCFQTVYCWLERRGDCYHIVKSYGLTDRIDCN